MPNIYLPPVITVPSALEISSITQSNPMVVTADPNSDQANTYIAGMAVRLNVPYTFGMFQANGLVGTIISINNDQFTLNIDSSLFDPFVIPAVTAEQPASLSPNGSRNLQYSNLTSSVPFQSLNNLGN